MNLTIEQRLSAFGAARKDIVSLKLEDPRAIDYLDLVGGIALDWNRTTRVQPAAVVEFERRPLLYVIEADSLATDPAAHEQTVKALRVKLACRGDAAWVGVLRPGQLNLYALGLSDDLPWQMEWRAEAADAHFYLQDLIAGRFDQARAAKTEQQAFHNLLFKLVTDANDRLLSLRALHGHPDDVLSLVGRALFSRFLIDRGLMNAETFPGYKGRFEECFSNPNKGAQTCRWLDKTFNGELLPLAGKRYTDFFGRLTGRTPTAFDELSNILHHSPDGQMTFDRTWGTIDFAHIPVGLLSEVYEQFAHQHGPKVERKSKTQSTKKLSLAKLESIHYTPRAIADYMLDQALPAVKTVPVDKARLLDPAVGGGVFLVLAFRKLVAARWKANDRRPNRKELRDILYNQLTGFDINVAALRLAALSLYLTALELDPDPTDPRDISFNPMLDRILFLARGKHEPHPNPRIMGSIGPVIGSEHDGLYDLVGGNPPWTAMPDAPRKVAAQELVRGIAAKRTKLAEDKKPLLSIAESYKNPDGVPDLPFVWRATEWAKKGGVIAFALHARLLFKRSDTGRKAREALFSGLRVTGVLNGAALRRQNVWPNVSAQWCLLFALNDIPRDDQVFYFVSPEIEKELNDAGIMRVDYDRAEPVQFSVLREEATLLKSLFRGSVLDIDLWRRLRNAGTTETVGAFWDRKKLAYNEGYQVASGSKDASAMNGLPDLRRTKHNPPFTIDYDYLPVFERNTLHRPKDRAIYCAPLIILPESLQGDRNNGSGLFATRDVAYSESFFGYSTRGFNAGDPDALARYLHALTYSKVFYHYVLMTSSKFGVERDVILKEDVDHFPIIPFEKLEPEEIDTIKALSVKIEAGTCPWNELDEWVFELYGLTALERQTINDTIAMALPFKANQDLAQNAIDEDRARAFCQVLANRLQLAFNAVEAKIEVQPRWAEDHSWVFLDVTCNGAPVKEWYKGWMAAIAHHSGATRVIAETVPGHLGIGMLAQQRYWTDSRAYLCALTVIREHSNHLLGIQKGQAHGKAG